MTNDAYAQYLAEVTYPHGEFTNHSTILALREAYLKGFQARGAYEKGSDSSTYPEYPQDPKHAASSDPLAAAKDLGDLLTNLGSAEKVYDALKTIIITTNSKKP